MTEPTTDPRAIEREYLAREDATILQGEARMVSEPTRLIRASSNLLADFGTRTHDGRTLTGDWGKPIGHDAETDEYIYAPTFTASGNTEAERTAEAVAALAAKLRAAVEGLTATRTYDPAYSLAVHHCLALIDQEAP